MLWEPEKLWDGEEAFIIGGGRSLLTNRFDFDVLRDEKVIGCNNAYQYGPRICNICIFGDRTWLLGHATMPGHQDRVAEYVEAGGFVVTNDNHMSGSSLVWLHWMRRRLKGLHTDALGWNKNTGASAINLALILGAQTVYLLGFDRFLTDGKPNWHDELMDKPSQKLYEGMNYCDARMKRDLKSKFPNRQVINVTDHSNYDVWPKVPLTGFFEQRKVPI